ncbi:hypothetical protein [Bdellovibrio sp. HCB337]|uniref:hypothetical protein n=1 Tax=Bdellovibrio sp. HCB337 TaxID=3394358 RepID=UPI0039A54F97
MKLGLALTGLLVVTGGVPSSALAQTDDWELYASPQLTFQYVTEQVFKPRCYKCHSDEGGNKDGVNLETYDNVYALRSKIRKMALVKKVMPPKKAGGPLNAREMSILDRWLRAGAPMGFDYETFDSDIW